MNEQPQQKAEQKRRHGRQRGRMAADSNTPWVSVGTLKEKMFCDRAAIIVSESIQDEGEDGLLSLGQYRAVPLYTLHAIARAIRERLMWLAGWTVLCVAGYGATQSNLTRVPDFLAHAAMFAGAVLAVKTLWHVLKLLAHQARAKAAGSRVPDFGKDEIQDIYWWGLVAAGFDVKRPHEALSDPKSRVVGKPWRVLQRHGQRIPVIRVRMGDPRIVRHHFARVAAYCHLLQKNEPGASSPGGIVLFTPGYDGKYLPNNHRSTNTFHTAVVDTRKLLTAVTEKHFTPPPPDSRRCSGCPHGRPTSRNDGFSYESDCGDRFGWTPPHERAFEKDLL